MLSSLEMIARDARNIRLAPHVASRTARNLLANGRLTAILADETGVFYVKGDVLRVTAFLESDQNLAKFNMRVDTVLQDDPAAYEAARVVSGVRVERGALDRERAERILRELMAD